MKNPEKYLSSVFILITNLEALVVLQVQLVPACMKTDQVKVLFDPLEMIELDQGMVECQVVALVVQDFPEYPGYPEFQVYQGVPCALVHHLGLLPHLVHLPQMHRPHEVVHLVAD